MEIFRLFVAVTLICFVFSPRAQAVSPAPDGCYPAFTTAEGCNALGGLTSGQGNTGIGWYALFAAGASNFSTGLGGGALALNTGDSNTAVGAAALLLNTSGIENTAVGTDALVHNTTGTHNTAMGAFSLFSNTTSGTNFGGENTAVGFSALFDNTIGFFNTANGSGALNSNVTGNNNTASGAGALASNTGNNNTALGFQAGLSATTGNGNVYIGSGMTGVAGESNACYIASIFGQVSPGGTGVLVNSDGKLGVAISSKRFKENIKAMDAASEVILALKPVSFRYKKAIDPKGILQFGLVAEDVEAVNPDLVVRDKQGNVNAVRYEAVNAMLLNEFLKEHRTVQQQQKEIDGLKAELKVQRALIQAVNDKVQLSKPAPHTVLNNP